MILFIVSTIILSASQGLAQDAVCLDDNGFFPDPTQCDAYYDCVNGTATWNLCPDGLGFLFSSYYGGLSPRCHFLYDVQCEDRTKLQPAKPSPHCPRQWGLYPHEDDCNQFWYCVDGVAYRFECPPTLAFNEETGNCDYPRYVSKCSEPEYPVQCPKLNELQQLFNPHPLLPDPEDCGKFYICMNGLYPRLQGCPPETLFDSVTRTCQNQTLVDCSGRGIQHRSEEESNLNDLDTRQSYNYRPQTRGRSSRINIVENEERNLQRIPSAGTEERVYEPVEPIATEAPQTEAPYFEEDEELTTTSNFDETADEDLDLITFDFDRRASQNAA